MNDLLLAVRAFNRPEYLKQCLKSLEVQSEHCDYYLFQDGAVNPISSERYATDEDIDKSTELLFRCRLPNKKIAISKKNIGGANVKIETLKFAFPKYKYLMMVDNDLIFNKYYIKTIKTLFKQFKEGMLQTSYRHHPDTSPETEKYIKENEDKVEYGFSHRWEQGLWRESWEKIKPLMKTFIEVNQRNDTMYLVRGNPTVRKDYHTLINEYGKTTDDFTIEACIKKAGLKGIHTKVLRHKSVGEHGQYTMTSGRWYAMNFETINVSDAGNIEKYVIVPSPTTPPTTSP